MHSVVFPKDAGGGNKCQRMSFRVSYFKLKCLFTSNVLY